MQHTIDRPTRSWRRSWLLAYQDAAGTPEDEILERTFQSDAEAVAWADAHAVVPLWLEEQETLIGELGRVLGVVRERHEI
jgi:hypothetical protein